MDMFIFGVVCAILGGCAGFIIGTVRGWQQTDELYARLTEEALLKMSRK
jgi:hypothetical protein